MVICGQCELEFDGDTEYLAHICDVTGVDPTDPQSMGKHWQTIQAEALKRGEEE